MAAKLLTKIRNIFENITNWTIAESINISCSFRREKTKITCFVRAKTFFDDISKVQW